MAKCGGVERSAIWRVVGCEVPHSHLKRPQQNEMLSDALQNMVKRWGLWNYNNEEFRPKRCISTFDKTQLNDLNVKWKDLKTPYSHFKKTKQNKLMPKILFLKKLTKP